MRAPIAGFVLLALSSAYGDAAIPPGQLNFFEKKVRPLLAEKCYSCHSADEKIKGGLRLDTKDSTLHGGDTGAVIEPGDPEASLLIEAITWEDDDLEMPPKEKLKPSEISDLKKWIKMGAPDPRVEESGSAVLTQSDIDYEKAREYWIYQALNASSDADNLDSIVESALKEKHLKAVGVAEPEKLARRLYYDLIGLPPTPGQLDAFLTEVARQGRDSATNRLVDDLLASSHFGERWGRHWLDVVRYAESNGMERNFLYPKAWKYRDYVITSFNDDKPFDQFVREQIAGDLLGSDEGVVATGFLAIGPKMLNERSKEVFGYEVIDEQIDATTRAFLGLTISCARCHDHKFDAFSQADYYALAGIFLSSQTHFGTQSGGGNRQASTLMAIGDDAEEKHAALTAYQKEMVTLTKQLRAREGKLKKAKQQLASLKKANNRPAIAKMEASMEDATDDMKEYRERVDHMKGDKPEAPDYAMGLSDRESPSNSALLIRGNPDTKADVIPRGIPTVFEPITGIPNIAEESSGRRELADWVARPDNPLTSRVMANRVWSHLLGEGIVPTVDNFGTSGRAPSNIALLDHLASSFIDHDWSVKSLIREIVLSDTYQRSTDFDQENYQIDPDNQFVWRQGLRRLDAESIRDSILSFSGDLSLSPLQGSVVAQMGNGNYGRDKRLTATLSKGMQTTHRSVYLPIVRNATPAGLKIFDFAESSLIVGKRNETNVPSQALFMMNSGFITRQSEQIVARLQANDSAHPGQAVERAFKLILGRTPREEETERAAKLIASHPTPEAGLITLCQALISSAEFRYLN